MIFYFSDMDNTDAIIKQLHMEAAELLASENSDEFIIDSLIKKGIDRHYAEVVLENVKNDISDRKEFYKHLFGGTFVFIAGGILTFGTFSIAKPGGLYFVFWGIMVYGIFSITRAFIIFRKK
jgi:hypothetical protein